NSLKEAKEKAYIDALIKIAQYLGISVSDKTIYSLNADFSSIDAKSKTEVKDTFLSQVIIKEFQWTKNKYNFVGYILLEIPKNLLEKEKARKEAEEKKRQKTISDRKNLGAFSIQVNTKEIQILIPDIKSHLQACGYTILNEGIPIKVNLIEGRFNESQGGIYSYELNIEINFNNDVKTISSKGFGNSRDNAKSDAYKTWLENFREIYR
ncbi:MAG: hypothetical protein LBT79_05380, partial [Elusimicrobiota bacterium]|nr:hypothetical protein [Elusimicrobiota bacterium]